MTDEMFNNLIRTITTKIITEIANGIENLIDKNESEINKNRIPSLIISNTICYLQEMTMSKLCTIEERIKFVDNIFESAKYSILKTYGN